jgi:hypothetical protein
MTLPVDLLSNLAAQHASHAGNTEWYSTMAEELEKQFSELHGPSSFEGP